MSRFKTKARAVDLLGDKQIKDDATAIYELFKNAHDADATEAEIQVDTKSGTLILWDDGHGMSPTDVETKWLTLGTDAKLSVSGVAARSEQRKRIMMGEKGIGRLAVASLGRQLVMITKRQAHPYVVVYIHWDVFTNGNLLLEDTVIPVEEQSDLRDLDRVLNSMKAQQLQNVVTPEGVLRPEWQGPYAKLGSQVRDQIDRLVLEWPALQPHLDKIAEKGSGTLFYVANLKEDWSAFANPAQTSPRLKKKRDNLAVMMSSFINSIRLFEEKHQDTYLDDVYSFHPRFLVDGQEVVSAETFGAEDLKRYDYGLVGTITGGVFQGQCYIQGRPTEDVTRDLAHGIDVRERADCGQFEVRLYFVEGEPWNSHLPEGIHAEITDKLNKIGGLYVYRDGLRVLPYGTVDYDFLEIEKRRTNNAGRYLFSLRRMFGYIAISKEANPLLQDKSSREGLIENDQYEFFRQVLMNLLIWWAMDYLTKQGRRKAHTREAEDRYKAKKAAEAAAKVLHGERDRFLREYRQSVSEGRIRLLAEAKGIETEIQSRIMTTGHLGPRVAALPQGKPESYFQIWTAIAALDEEKRRLLQRIAALEAVAPLPVDIRFDSLGEVTELRRAHADLMTETKTRLQFILEDRWSTAHEYLNGHLQQFLDRVSQELHVFSGATFIQGLQDAVKRSALVVESARASTLSRLSEEVNRRHDRYQDQLQALSRTVTSKRLDCFAQAERAIEGLFASLETKVDEISNLLQRFTSLNSAENMKSLVDAINEKSQDLEVQLSGVIQEADGHIQSALAGLSIPTLDLLDQAIAMADDRRLLGVLETRLQEMNSQMEMYRGLVSTGLAAEVVNHEFNQQYELIHKIFEKPQVKALLSQYPDIQRVDELFRHIEERHRLLSPLYRRNRLYRKTLSIYEIAERMRQLFANHLDLYDIKFRNEIDKDFVVYESEPILYPVFINLLNNALYWLLNKSQRVILLHSDTTQGSLFIEDSGPGIEPERTERIFELFYSTRVDGRGIGLHLVRELLSSRNHLIDCVTSGPQKFLGDACFRIQFDPDAVRPGGEAK